MALPGGAQLINTHEDLLNAFTSIDQRLHRIIGGNEPPYIYRNKLYLPCSMYSIALGAIGSGGERIHGGSATAGPHMSVVEDNSSTINTNTSRTYVSLGGIFKSFGGIDTGNTGQTTNAYPKKLGGTLTADGAGEISAATLVAGVSGYQPCLVITGVWSDTTDGSINLTFAPSAGTFTVGPSTVNIATTANQFTPDFHQGISFFGDTDNTSITVAAAAGQCGAAQVIQLEGYYWYET
jgi:hypothetical protein